MRLDLFQNIANEIKKIDINEFIKEIRERLEKMEEEIVIDRFENNIAVCEDIKTGKIIEIPRKSIEKDAKEGDIIKNIEGIYKKNIKKQEEVESRIKEKMDKLWK